MNVVSIKEAMGSAATARAAGNAIPNISLERESSFKICLHFHITKYDIRETSYNANYILLFLLKINLSVLHIQI